MNTKTKRELNLCIYDLFSLIKNYFSAEINKKNFIKCSKELTDDLHKLYGDYAESLKYGERCRVKSIAINFEQKVLLVNFNRNNLLIVTHLKNTYYMYVSKMEKENCEVFDYEKTQYLEGEVFGQEVFENFPTIGELNEDTKTTLVLEIENPYFSIKSIMNKPNVIKAYDLNKYHQVVFCLLNHST